VVTTESITAEGLLRLKRQQRGLSARGLSVSAGLSDSYVSRLEAGSIEMSLKSFSKLAHALHMNIHEIALIINCEATR
jgi:transcriptional regulator with XRE-family HTH domain